MDIANVPAMINRVTYTGDLGYEIWVAPEYQRRLYAAIMEAGRDLGIVNFGMRALLCLRLEKNFPTWYRELRPIYGAFEAGLDRFVDLEQEPTSSAARPRCSEKAERRTSCAASASIVDATDADVLGDEPIWHDGKVIGWVTSGGYGHYVDTLAGAGLRAQGAGGRDRRGPLRDRDPRRAAQGHDHRGAAVRSRGRAHARLAAAGGLRRCGRRSRGVPRR